MDLISKITIKISSKKVGVDEFGNQYFEAKKSYNNRKKRSVIYKGIAEPSKIPAEWHGWMHYSRDEVPKATHKHPWQKVHLPNLTGTKFARFSFNRVTQSKNPKLYQPWQPK